MDRSIENRKRISVFAWATMIAIAVNIVYWQFVFRPGAVTFIETNFGNVNLVQYAGSAVLYVIAIITAYRLVNMAYNRKTQRQDGGGKAVSRVFFIVALALCGVLVPVVIVSLGQENGYQPGAYYWNQLPAGFLVAVALLAFAAFFFLSNRIGGFSADSAKKDALWFWFMAGAVALLAGYLSYYPNGFYPDAGHHFDAVYNSVYNVFYGVPYSEDMVSIYGYYGIFLAPFLHLAQALGETNLLQVFAAMMAVTVTLVYLCVAYAIQVFVKNKALRVLGVLAMACNILAGLRTTFSSPQLNFLRPVAIGVFLLLVALYTAHPRRRKLLGYLGYLVTAVLFAWCLDTGLVAIFAWMAFMLCLELQRFKAKERKSWLALLLHIGLAVGAGLLAMAMVSLYNLSVGGKAMWAASFFASFTTVSGLISSFSPLQNLIMPWVAVLFIYLFFLGRGVASTKLCGRDAETDVPVAGVAAIAVFGFGIFFYYVNLPNYSYLNVAVPTVTLLLCVGAQSALPYLRTVFSKGRPAKRAAGGVAAGLGLAAVFVLFLLSVASTTNLGTTIQASEVYKHDENMKEMAAAIEAAVPEDTIAYGTGMPMLYSMISRDANIHLTDDSDSGMLPVAVENLKELFTATVKDDALLVSKPTMDIIKNGYPDVYSEFMQAHYLYTYWENESFGVEYYKPLAGNEVVLEKTGIVLPPENTAPPFAAPIDAEADQNYAIVFEVEAQDAPRTFYVDFFGADKSLKGTVAPFELEPGRKTYAATISTGGKGMEGPVEFRIVSESGQPIMINGLKVYKIP